MAGDIVQEMRCLSCPLLTWVKSLAPHMVLQGLLEVTPEQHGV